jgi:NhaA family Na+:H+ antiporter
VAFLILPLFALANTCISITGIGFNDLYVAGVYGTIAGLVFGKPVGIFLFTFLSKKLFHLNLPTGVNFKHILGAGIVAGIGFTMSIFITDLAFTHEFYIKQIKLAILFSALVSSLMGIFYFKLFIPKVKADKL